MNTTDAIRFLQALINSPVGRTPKDQRDLGWCCTEHALVFALALLDCGLPCQIAEGAVFIRGPKFHDDVVYHAFVVCEEELFDSSIRFDDVRGVVSQQVPFGPLVRLTPIVPTWEDTMEACRNAPERTIIWYSQQRVHDPRAFARVTSPTLYGHALTSMGIAHRDFWTAASSKTALILRGEMELPASLPDRDTLIKETVENSSRPGRD